jgi:hypothetical protein
MAFSWGSLPWGDIISGGVQLGAGLIGGNADKKSAQAAGNLARPLPWSGTSMFGSTQFNPGTQSFDINMAANPFAQVFNQGGLQSLGNAFSAPGSAYYGAAPELAGAANAMFGPEQDAAAAERLGALRAIAQPEEQRMFNRLEDNQFARGTSGTTGGGIQSEAFYKAQQDADLKRSLASQDWAQSRAMDRFQTAMQAVGSGQAGQVNQFNMGNQAQQGLQAMFQQLLNQGNMGISSGSGMPAEFAAGASANPITGQVLPFLQQSGAFDALGKWVGGQFGGGATPAPATAPQPGPMRGGYQFPAGGTPGGYQPSTQTLYGF